MARHGVLLGETAYDRERGLLYILELLVEGEDKPLVHVWCVCTRKGYGPAECGALITLETRRSGLSNLLR